MPQTMCRRGAASRLSKREPLRFGSLGTPEHQASRNQKAGVAKGVALAAFVEVEVLDRDRGVASELRLNLDLSSQDLRDEVDDLGRPRAIPGRLFLGREEVLVRIAGAYDRVALTDRGRDAPVIPAEMDQVNVKAILVKPDRRLLAAQPGGVHDSQHLPEFVVESPRCCRQRVRRFGE